MRGQADQTASSVNKASSRAITDSQSQRRSYGINFAFRKNQRDPSLDRSRRIDRRAMPTNQGASRVSTSLAPSMENWIPIKALKSLEAALTLPISSPLLKLCEPSNVRF